MKIPLYFLFTTDGSAAFLLKKETVSYCWSTASEDKDADLILFQMTEQNFFPLYSSDQLQH